MVKSFSIPVANNFSTSAMDRTAFVNCSSSEKVNLNTNGGQVFPSKSSYNNKFNLKPKNQ